MEPIFFTSIAAILKSGGSGIVGNAEYTALCRALPAIDKWYRGAGQPVNHHLQRALRYAYLAATRRLFTHTEAYALRWLEAEEEKLKDASYHPPEPPGGWEPAYILEPTLEQAQTEVARLRASFQGMLREEWRNAGLSDPPRSVENALSDGWSEGGTHLDWFNLIGMYFTAALEEQSKAESAYVIGQLAKILIKLEQKPNGALAVEAPRAPFHAPSARDYFVGRVAERAALRERLRTDGSVVPLTGQPGLGKTSLALDFAHQCAADFEGVLWIDCSGVSLGSAAQELGKQLGLPPELPQDRLVEELHRRAGGSHYLLVLDNVDTDDFRALLPGGHSAVLITTRRADLAFLTHHRPPDLHVFTPEEGLDLFRDYLGRTRVDGHQAEYRQLGESLGWLPLGVSVAAGLLKDDAHYTLNRLLKETQLHRLKHGDLDIDALLRSAIASAGEPARKLLAAMAVCAPSGFRLALAAEVSEMDQDAALDALQDLRSRSLVEELDRDAARYRLHSLIRAVVGQDTRLEQRHAEAVAQRFEHWQENWRECEEDLPDWRLARDRTRQGGTECVNLFGRLLDSGFGLARTRGLMAEALGAMQLAQEVFENLGDRARLGAIYGCQALILQAWGRTEEAMALHKRQEAIGEELGDRADLQACYGNQAVILRAWGRLEDAMAMLKRQEAICEELGNRAGLQRSYGNQALILEAWGRLEDAMALHKRQEAICRELGDRADLGGNYGNQALILEAWGRSEDAMVLLKREEGICEELGDRDGLQRSYGNQALILETWGRLDDAMTLHKRKEAICRELGLRNSLRIALNNEANILDQIGQAEGAARARAEAEAIQAELMRGSGSGGAATTTAVPQ